MYIISNSNIDYTLPPEERYENSFITSLSGSITFSYMMALGDFETSELGVNYYLLAIIFFILATLFLTIMMLNLLVAVISGTYERVRDSSISVMYKTMADLTAENEYLVPNSDLAAHDAQGDYMYLAIMDSTGDDTLSEADSSI